MTDDLLISADDVDLDEEEDNNGDNKLGGEEEIEEGMPGDGTTEEEPGAGKSADWE